MFSSAIPWAISNQFSALFDFHVVGDGDHRVLVKGKITAPFVTSEKSRILYEKLTYDLVCSSS